MASHKDDAYVAEWFKEHQATFEEASFKSGVPITRILWKKPNTSCYRVDYLIYGGMLLVCGDLGDAAYQWSGSINLKFLAGCDIGYFGGKCRASSQEPRGKTWDSERVQRWIEEKLAEWATDNPIVNIDGPEETETPRAPITFERCVELMWDEDCESLDERITHPQAWSEFRAESKGLILSDTEVEERSRTGEKSMEYPRMQFECCEDYDVGYTWDLHTRAHLIGLKMAYAQLQAREAAAKADELEKESAS